MSDVYYSPEKHGLKPVFETDYSSESYEFDLRVIWLHEESGRYYTARDSGCSCPCPFEDSQEPGAGGSGSREDRPRAAGWNDSR